MATDIESYQFEAADTQEESPLAEDWAALARKAAIEAVPNLRKAATAWAGTVGTLLGLFSTVALIGGPATLDKVIPAAREQLASLTVVAIGFAAIGTFLAAAASQGGIRSVVPTADELEQASSQEIVRARTQLRFSKISTFLVLPVLAAILIIGTQNLKEDPSPGTVLATYRNAESGQTETVCGSLQSATSGLLVRPGKGRADVGIPTPHLVSLSPTPSCP